MYKHLLLNPASTDLEFRDISWYIICGAIWQSTLRAGNSDFTDFLLGANGPWDDVTTEWLGIEEQVRQRLHTKFLGDLEILRQGRQKGGTLFFFPKLIFSPNSYRFLLPFPKIMLKSERFMFFRYRNIHRSFNHRQSKEFVQALASSCQRYDG